jgi:hypothetical protein
MEHGGAVASPSAVSDRSPFGVSVSQMSLSCGFVYVCSLHNGFFQSVGLWTFNRSSRPLPLCKSIIGSCKIAVHETQTTVL